MACPRILCYVPFPDVARGAPTWRSCIGHASRISEGADSLEEGRYMNLYEVAEEIAGRLGSIFLRDRQGRRPVYGGMRKFQEDPHWRDHLLFFEYFHGDNGAGIGASHQTGWTGLVAPLIQLFGHLDAEGALEPDDRVLARPYRRVTGESMADIGTAREARGVRS